MHPFRELFDATTSSRFHDKMIRFARPLKEHLLVNHFWYYRVTDSGQYTFLGTHSDWTEYCFDTHLLSAFPMLRHPSKQKGGITLMNQTPSEGFSSMQKEAWEKFQIHFNLNLTTKISGGVEAFGFATSTQSSQVEEDLLNELPLLTTFIAEFRKENKELLDLAHHLQVDISSYLGPKFYEETPRTPLNKSSFLQAMDWLPPTPLTAREETLLVFLASGHTAPYIGKKLRLATRTVENYIQVVKEKLHCSSKNELIEKAKFFHSQNK